jgi:hypothetical protein
MRQKLLALYSFAFAVVASMIAPVMALATDTPATVTVPTLVDTSALGSSFGTLVGGAIAVGVGIMFAVAIVIIAKNWILKGGKSR